MSLQTTEHYQPTLFTSENAIEEQEYSINLEELEARRQLAISKHQQEMHDITQELIDVKNTILEIIDNPLLYPDLKTQKARDGFNLVYPFQVLRQAIHSAPDSSHNISFALEAFVASEFFPSHTESLLKEHYIYFAVQDNDVISKKQHDHIRQEFKAHIATLDRITKSMSDHQRLQKQYEQETPESHRIKIAEQSQNHRHSIAENSLKNAFIDALTSIYQDISRNNRKNNRSLGAIRGSVDSIRMKTKRDELQWKQPHIGETLLETHVKEYEHYSSNDPEAKKYMIAIQALITSHIHNLQLITDVNFINEQWNAAKQPLTTTTQSYADALKTLHDALDNPSTNVQPTIRYFVNAIQQCIVQKHKALHLSEPVSSTSKETLHDLTSMLIHLNEILENQPSVDHVAYYEAMGKKMIDSVKYKKLGQLLLGLGGFLLISASIALGLFSGGALLQLGIYGTTIGAALVGTAITASTVSLAGGGLLFWSSKQTAEILDQAYQDVQEKCIATHR